MIIEEKSTYKNYQFIICFNDILGHRCGYVGIPENNKVYKRDMNDIFIKNINCHGGITFCNFDGLLGSDYWWIGFDCGHNCDGIDIETLKLYANEYRLNLRKSMSDYERRINNHVYTLDECIDDCKQIINQIIQINENY